MIKDPLGRVKNLKKAMEIVFEAVDGMEIGDTMFGCTAVIACCLGEFDQEDRAMFRDRIVAMLHEVDNSSRKKNGIQ